MDDTEFYIPFNSISDIWIETMAWEFDERLSAVEQGLKCEEFLCPGTASTISEHFNWLHYTTNAALDKAWIA